MQLPLNLLFSVPHRTTGSEKSDKTNNKKKEHHDVCYPIVWAGLDIHQEGEEYLDIQS